MSRYDVTETVFTDAGHLCGALQDMGFQPTVHAEPVNLYGHHGDVREDLAHVVVPRDQIHYASNDVGFFRESDGKFRAIVSEFDQGFAQNAIGQALDGTWLGRLAQKYSERVKMQVGRELGYRFLGREEIDGKVRLRWEVPESSHVARVRSSM